MTTETDLLPLPDVKCWRAMKDRNGNVGYSDKPDPKYSESAGTDGLTWVRLDDHKAALQAYARANVAHFTAPLQAEIEALRADLADYMRIANTEATRAERLAEALEFRSALTKTLLPYQDEAVASRAEIKALRVDVEAWKASHSLMTDTCHHFQARAKRLEEALREMREYVAAELQGQREAFAGCEHCSDIPGIEADLHKIDTLLREQEEGK